MNFFNNEIASITEDSSIDPEEAFSLSEPFYRTQLDTINQSELFNRSMYIAIYCYWETSLYGIIRFYNKADSSKKSKPASAMDHIKTLGFPINSDINLLNSSLKELRNFFVHGSLYPNRQKIINRCLEKYRISGLLEGHDGYSISSVDFLQAILDLIYKTLCDIESSCIKPSKETKQF